jgi:hypothetical protein
MINLLFILRHPLHPIRLNVEFRSDLQWWVQFIEEWNGTNFFLLPGLMPLADLVIISMPRVPLDMAPYTINRVVHQSFMWSPAQMPLSIAYKDFFSCCNRCNHLWGIQWANRRVCFQLDNTSVVHILNSRTSRDTHIMALLRSLLGVAAR